VTAQDGLSTINLVNPLLNSLRGAPFQQKTVLYPELHTAVPGIDGTTAVSTGAPPGPAAGAGQRYPIVLGAAASGSIATIGDTATWLNNAITGEVITDLAFWSAGANGVFLMSAPFNAPITWNPHDTITLGSLTLTLGPAAATGVYGPSAALILALLNAIAGTSFSIPTLYVKLHTGIPGAAGATAPAAGDTSRKLALFSPAANAAIPLMGTPPTWTNGGTTETVTALSLWSASTAGTFWYSVPLSAPILWDNADVITLSTLTLSMGPLATSL
jgi:hypothetical protein